MTHRRDAAPNAIRNQNRFRTTGLGHLNGGRVARMAGVRDDAGGTRIAAWPERQSGAVQRQIGLLPPRRVGTADAGVCTARRLASDGTRVINTTDLLLGGTRACHD